MVALPSSELQRNDVESLVIQSHCQLELWDDDDGLEMGTVPDIIIDNTVNNCFIWSPFRP